MIPADRAARLPGYGEAVGIDGHRVGKAGQVYLDHRTGGRMVDTRRGPDADAVLPT